MKKILLFWIALLFSWNTTKAQTALDFDGTDDFVECGTNLSNISNFTIEANIYYRGGAQWVLNFCDGTYNERLQLEINGGSLWTYSESSVGGGVSFGGGVIATNQWYHVALTNDIVSGKKLYIDGVLVASDASTLSPSQMPGNIHFNIGRIYNLPYFFNGQIDQVRVWNVTRTQAEIFADKVNCLTGLEDGLIALYDFEDGTNSATLTDLAGGNDNGTLTNMDPASDWVSGIVCVPTCITNQSVTAAPAALCSGSSSTITVNTTETGVNYTLRDNADNTIIAGPMAGTGASIGFSTGALTADKTYNVYAEKTSPSTSGALDFDAANQYVRVNNVTLPQPYTLETWVMFKPGGCMRLVVGDANVLMIDDNNATNDIRITAAGPTFIAPNVIIRNQWIHFAVVVDGVNSKVYVDGIQVATGNLGTNTLNVTNFDIGATGSPYNQCPINGQIDDFRLWSGARTAGQISANMNSSLTGTEPGLYALYDFEDGTGSSTATDITGNGHNGTLINMDPATDWVTRPTTTTTITCTLQMPNTPTVTINPLNNTITQNAGELTANQGSATYQWYECPNTLLSGETNQSFTPTVIGDYKVEITLGACTIESACENVAVLGSEDFENITKFSIYPNPTSGLLNINTSFDGQFIIVNQLGQIVHSFKATSTVENVINVENLTNGIYFIKEINETLINSQKLIIKK
jgi:hypothetical protein